MHTNNILHKKNCKDRGFVTIATGNQKYYQMALNLLHSYRVNGNSSLPFAIICDKVCEESQEFDDIILIDSPYHSYLDKLSLFDNLPYNETIFIDADSLILSSVDILWEDFLSAGDFSCYGKPLPLHSKIGWFYYEDMGELKKDLSFCVSMHGGLYYLRKTDTCRNIFKTAVHFANNYNEYKFAIFNKPADEPVLALSMALHNCKPCNINNRIYFLPSHDGKFTIGLNGNLKYKKKDCNPPILHFGNRHTPRYLYQYLRTKTDEKYYNQKEKLNLSTRIKLRVKCFPVDSKFFIRRTLRKILPVCIINLFKSFKK